ncbi:hypothetical protein IIU_07078 [Bacillus cereus VD133]|uniref:Uncharacterized protein n=1 Tax=Bacillus cereus VD133 TaxID=1053233 RepID=A0A9W5PJ24_BACCE|nr:hypothetical protein [Bacillus cereus]EOO23154.1 hypothetical protein IIU_07078 [Bacillus cereus VD133]
MLNNFDEYKEFIKVICSKEEVINNILKLENDICDKVKQHLELEQFYDLIKSMNNTINNFVKNDQLTINTMKSILNEYYLINI